MARSRRRLVRVMVVLPALASVTVYGYWRFLGSDAFRVLVERILASALRAEVSIGSHEVVGPATIALSDLSIAFRADDVPSGIRLRTGKAYARAEQVLGIGAFEEVTLSDTEAVFDCPVSRAARLDFVTRRRPSAAIRKLNLQGITLSVASGEKRYRVGGISAGLDLSEGLSLDVGLVLTEIEGMEGSAEFLGKEAPRMELSVEVHGAVVAVRKLYVESRTGWKLEGEMEADLVRDPVVVRGELDFWDLPVSRVYEPPEDIEISEKAHIKRHIAFSGPVDRLRVEVTLDVKGVDFVDKDLELEAKGVTLGDLRSVRYYDVLRMLQRLLEEKDEKRKPDKTEQGWYRSRRGQDRGARGKLRQRRPAEPQIQGPSGQRCDRRPAVGRTAALKGERSFHLKRAAYAEARPPPSTVPLKDRGPSFGGVKCLTLNLRISMSLLPKPGTLGALCDQVNGCQGCTRYTG